MDAAALAWSSPAAKPAAIDSASTSGSWTAMPSRVQSAAIARPNARGTEVSSPGNIEGDYRSYATRRKRSIATAANWTTMQIVTIESCMKAL